MPNTSYSSINSGENHAIAHSNPENWGRLTFDSLRGDRIPPQPYSNPTNCETVAFNHRVLSPAPVNATQNSPEQYSQVDHIPSSSIKRKKVEVVSSTQVKMPIDSSENNRDSRRLQSDSDLIKPIHEKRKNDSDLIKPIPKECKLNKCEICDKLFSRPQTLQRHQLNHINEKKFKCTPCRYSSNRQDHLNLHKKSSKHKLVVNDFFNADKNSYL